MFKVYMERRDNMSKLHYIKSVWDNLEENYSNYCKKSALSRTDYLKALIAFDNNSNGATILENYLSDEVDSYNETEYELYDSLRQMFNEVYDKLQALGNRLITSFAELLQSEICAVSISDYTGFTKRVFHTPDFMLQNGLLLNTTMLTADHSVLSYAVENMDDYLIINSVHQLTNFLYDEEIASSEFKKTAYIALTTLAQNGKLTTPIVIMGNRYFELHGKTFVAGKIKHAYKNVDLGVTKFNTLGGVECKANGNFVLFRVNLGKKICTVIGVKACP